MCKPGAVTVPTFFCEKRGYDMHNMRPHIAATQFPFSNEVGLLLRYVILHELLQDCDVVLRIDGGFHWTYMSVYHASVIEESNHHNLIRELCWSFFSAAVGLSAPTRSIVASKPDHKHKSNFCLL